MDIAKHNLAGLADGTIDPLDCIGLVEMVDIDLYSGVRGAKIISEDLLYLDEEKTKPRIKIATSHTFFSYADSDIAFYVNHDAKSNVVLYMKEGEKLSDILTQLPHGLIDKKITGIGATTLEIKSPRNSIIVVPTRRLAMQKVDKENKEQGKEVCLYVGSKDNADSTSPTDINTYLDKDEIEYKKIVVVADSLGKVIQTIQKRDVDVYRDYFFMVDEIDTLQSDGHFRDNLENVIDYYLKLDNSEHTHPLFSAKILYYLAKNSPKSMTFCHFLGKKRCFSVIFGVIFGLFRTISPQCAGSAAAAHRFRTISPQFLGGCSR